MWVFPLALGLGFLGMEPVSWAVHKYIMHGPLWFIHQTHHIHKGKGFWELNDLFSLFFGGCSAVLIYLGLQGENLWLSGIGFGIALYGLFFFIFHDLLIHKRLPLVRKVKFKGCIGRIVKAHFVHHKSMKHRAARYFGLLYVKDKNPE